MTLEQEIDLLFSDDKLRTMYAYDYRAKDLVEKTADVEVLEYYAVHPFEPFRLLVAENVSTPSHVLKLMVNDKGYNVARAVARHKNVTVEIIEALADSGNVLARETIARNPLTPEHILYKLSKDDSVNGHKLREALLTNPKLPEKLFMSIQGGENVYKYFDIEILRNPALPKDLIRQIWFAKKSSRIMLLGHPNLSPELAWLALNSENDSSVSRVLEMEEKNPKLFKKTLVVGCKYLGFEKASEDMPTEWLKSYLTSTGFKLEVLTK